MTPLLEVADLTKTFPVRSMGSAPNTLLAVDGVSFTVGHEQTVALVGESGCGKSTTGLAALRLIEPSSGNVAFDGVDLLALGGRELRRQRRRMQAVFQDPRGQLDPRMRIGQIISEPLRAHRLGSRSEQRERSRELLEMVGLGAGVVDRYPHQLSGGQRQRVGIARALAPSPSLVLCDESVSALDVSVQTQVLNLLRDLQQQLAVSYLFIAHALPAVRYVADRVVVMYLGREVESAPAAEFFAGAAHPYSAALLSAVPSVRTTSARERIVLRGDVPSPFGSRQGCVFRSRCFRAQQICTDQTPPVVEISSGHTAACHFPLA